MTDDLNDVQKIGLDLLKKIIFICEEERITYYAIAGTLLGAIRHNGFIPWDDDIDIAMPREDYEKFLNVFKKYDSNDIRLVNYQIDPQYLYYYSKLEDIRYTFEDALHEGESIHVGVDIFAIDGSPNNKLIRKLYYYRIFCHHALVTLCNTDILKKRNRGFIINVIVALLIFLSKIIPFNKITNPYKEKKKMDYLMSKYSMNDSKFVGPLLGGYREREMVPQDCFGKKTMHVFEDIYISIPENYDKFLSYIYGDYMKIPENKNEIKHYVIAQDDE